MFDGVGFGGSEERQRRRTAPTATADVKGSVLRAKRVVRALRMFDGVGFGRSLLLMVGIGLGMPLGVRLDCDLQPFGRSRPRVLLHPRPESRVVDVQSALLYMKGMVHLVEPA